MSCTKTEIYYATGAVAEGKFDIFGVFGESY